MLKIKPMSKRYGKRYYGLYWQEDKTIELSNMTFRKTIKTLIHETHHYVLDILKPAYMCWSDYDKIANKLEKYIFSKENKR